MTLEREVLRKLFEEMVEATSDAIILVDENGEIALTNAASERLLGYELETLTGVQVDTLVPERYRDHARLRARFSEDPEPRPMGSGLDLHALRADGSEIPVDISLTPVKVEDGDWTVITMRDMRGSAHRNPGARAQDAALRAAANGIVITDRDATILWVNPAVGAITGYAPDEMIGRHTRLLRSGRHDQKFYENLWQTIRRGEIWSGTIVNRRKDGTLYHEEQTIAPVFGDDGEISNFIAIKQDITEKVEALERLKSVDAAKTTLLHAIAHDLRVPLSIIMGSALTIQQMPDLDRETVERLAKAIADGSKRMERILGDLLDLDRIDKGQLEPDLTIVELASVVARALDEADTRGRDVAVGLAVDTVQADRAMLERIFVNLIGNAAKHTPPEGRIWVSVGASEGGGLIRVEDEGPGVPEDLRRAIFDDFRQGEPGPGVGIGLSLVRDYAALHGGRAWVEDREGGGASFRVFLPGTTKPQSSAPA